MDNKQEYIDDYERKTFELIAKLTKDNYRNNAIVFREAANQIKDSAHPEAQEIYAFMMGMSIQHEAKDEKNPHNAIKLFDEAIGYLSKCKWDDKQSNEYIETKILKLIRQTEINKQNPETLADLFLEIAIEEKKIGKESGHNTYMGLHHLYKSTYEYPRNPVKQLRELDFAVDSFKKAGNTEFEHRIMGLRYRVLAYFQPTYESRLTELNNALREVEQTEDKTGLNEIKASICYITAQSERDPARKAKLFKEASIKYKKSNFINFHNDAIAWSYIWEAHNPTITLDESISLINKAEKHFKKAGSVTGHHCSLGFLFLLRAIKGGIVKNKDTAFIKNLAEANQHFAKCGQAGYANLTAGSILLIEAAKLPSEKSKHLLKKSAEMLSTTSNDLYHLALYHYCRIEACDNIESTEYRNKCEQEALTHIEFWLDNTKPDLNQEVSIYFGFNPDLIKTFYKAEAYGLKGRIEKDAKTRIEYFRAAISQYDKIISANFWLPRAWHAKGWIFMFLFELDKAHEAFSRAYELNPNDNTIQKDIEFATEQLKRGFHDLKQMYREESRFSRRLQTLLIGTISQSRQLMINENEGQPGQGFYQRALNYLQRAGLAVEENYPQHVDKDEEGLRDELVQCLKMVCNNVAAESKKAKGKRDITIKDDSSNRELAVECLVWNGPTYYESKKEQLFSRYLTWHNQEAVLVTFVRGKNFIDVLTKAVNSIKTLSNMIENSFQDLSQEAHKLYISEHKHVSGVTTRLYHVLFHLPKEENETDS